MNEKAKSALLSVSGGISVFLKYILAIIKPSIKNIGVILICSLAVFGFYDTSAPLAMKGLYHFAIKAFYILMVTVCLASAAVTVYKTGKRHLLSPENKAEKFRFFNGFIIGVVTAAPFIIMCIVANSNGFTYYKSDSMTELAKLILYVYAFWFSEYPTAADFSYMQFMLLSLAPITVCTFSYIAPKIIYAIKETKKTKGEAV